MTDLDKNKICSAIVALAKQPEKSEDMPPVAPVAQGCYRCTKCGTEVPVAPGDLLQFCQVCGQGDI